MKLTLGGNEFAYGLLNEEGQFVAVLDYAGGLFCVEFAPRDSEEVKMLEELGQCGPVYSSIKSREVQHGGGNIWIDLIELQSGKVLALNGEVAVLYPSRAAFDDPETDASDFPTIPLYEEG